MEFTQLSVEERRQILMPRVAAAERAVFIAELDRVQSDNDESYQPLVQAQERLEILRRLQTELESEQRERSNRRGADAESNATGQTEATK